MRKGPQEGPTSKIKRIRVRWKQDHGTSLDEWVGKLPVIPVFDLDLTPRHRKDRVPQTKGQLTV